MATKSFLKSVNIKSRKQAKDFVKALEKAEKFSKQEKVIYNRSAYEVKHDEVAKVLERVRWA